MEAVQNQSGMLASTAKNSWAWEIPAHTWGRSGEVAHEWQDVAEKMQKKPSSQLRMKGRKRLQQQGIPAWIVAYLEHE